ncbi:MAG TPA: YtxH domain-containing protein [Longimicrobiaceae bacterium]|jgi:gas vesicle protein|nr:YtxH domain-containing protein [Longimicrobiaceae bacterium]
MAHHDEVPYIVLERRSGATVPFLWGALIGAGVALLFAPRSGTATQAELRRGFGRLRLAAEDRVYEARDNVADAVERTRENVFDQLDGLRDAVEAKLNHARDAVEAGRRAADERRDDLRERVTDAKRAYGGGDLEGYDDRTDRNEAMTAPGALEDVLAGEPDVEVVVTEIIVEEDAGDARPSAP